MPVVLFKTDFIEIKYYASKKLVETTWVGLPPSQEYRNALKGAIAILKTHDVRRWIGDYRKAVEMDLPDQDWAMEEWAPVFMADTVKLEKMAKVMSEENFSNRAATISNKLATKHKGTFAFAEFDDYDQAMKWING